MGWTIWFVGAFLIFWLATLVGTAWLFLRLMRQQALSSQQERNRMENLFESQLEQQQSLFSATLQEHRDSSQDSLDSARDQFETTLSAQQSLAQEAIKQATFGVSSANQTLANLTNRLIPILAAKDAIAAGQLSTLTAPAEEQSVGPVTPYTAENEAVLEQIESAMNMLRESGIADGDLAARTAASVLLPSV